MIKEYLSIAILALESKNLSRALDFGKGFVELELRIFSFKN